MIKKSNFLLLVILFFLGGKIFSQEYTWEQIKQVDPWYIAERPDFTELDEYVKTIGYAAKTPQEIAVICIKDCKTQYEKARAIFDWLSFNIAYDTSFKVGSGEKCFEVKKGVCQGYAELYEIMCDSVGLECYMIVGQGRSHGFDGHAWNIICLNDEKRDILVDCCWGAGYVNSGRFKKEFKPWWFDSHPSIFVLTHVPSYISNELLEYPLTLEQVKKLPEIKCENYTPDKQYGPQQLDRLLNNPKGSISEDVPYGIPAIACNLNRNIINREYYFRTGKNAIDGFLVTNLEVEETIGCSLAEIAKFCNEKSKEANLQCCYEISEEGKVTFNINGEGYRLPSIDEWFFALGKKDSISSSISEISKKSWFDLNSSNKAHSSGQKKVFDNGLFDMIGNKSELCYGKDGNLYLMGGNYKQDLETILKFEPEPFRFSNLSEEEKKSFSDTITIRLVRSVPKNYDSLYLYAESLLEWNQTEKNIPLYLEIIDYLVENKYPNALVEYGMDKYLGTYGSIDKETGMKAITEAAEMKSPAALHVLGFFYENGEYFEKDIKKAFDYYLEAAELGNPNSQSKVCDYYHFGLVVTKDEEKAFYWLEKASTSNNNEIQRKYAEFLQKGYGCEKQENKAFLLYKKLADAGDLLACQKVGDCYKDKIGCAKENYYAVKYYTKAYEKGYFYSGYKLTELYLTDTVGSRNIPKALEIFENMRTWGDEFARYQKNYEDLLKSNELIKKWGKTGEIFLKQIPSFNDVRKNVIQFDSFSKYAEQIQDCELTLPTIVGDLTFEEIGQKFGSIGYLTICDGGEEDLQFEGNVLVIIQPNELTDKSHKIITHCYTEKPFTQTKVKVGSDYYRYDESFYSHYNHIILLSENGNLDKAFEKLAYCTKKCTSLDVLTFSNKFLSNPEAGYASSYISIVDRFIQKGTHPRIIGLDNSSDVLQKNVNQLFSSEIVPKIHVFGTPYSLTGELGCGFRQGNLFMVLRTTSSSGKNLLIYLDETGWAPEPTKKAESFVQDSKGFNALIGKKLNSSGSITKEGKMVMHYKVVK